MKIILTEDDVLEAIARYVTYKLGDDIPPVTRKDKIRFIERVLNSDQKLVMATNQLSAEVILD